MLKDQPAANQEQAEAMPEDRWKELETLNARFDAELAYADSCLEEEPPPSDMEMLLASASELRRAAILQRFVDRVYFLRFNDPRQGLSITENIVAWTENPTPLVAVVRCRALMERGNLLRIFGEREGAYEALAAAWEELDDHGITDPLELARYEELLGTLEAYSGNFARARHLLTEALLKVRRWGDNHSLQRVLISAGLVELRLDNFDLAQSLFEEAIRTAEPESLLLLCAATNRVLGYFVSGQPQLAYREICRLRARFGDCWLESLPRLLQMRQTWLEGQVRNALGMEEEAIGLLKKARESFIRADRGYEVCYTSIDLALTYATQRRFAEVQHELAFALPFCSDEPTIERFGKEAVQLLLRTLVRQGRLDVELIRAVSSRLYDIGRAPLRVFPHSPLAELRI